LLLFKPQKATDLYLFGFPLSWIINLYSIFWAFFCVFFFEEGLLRR